ncbi:MAG TPA: DinB family protein, partial [Dehalococcoidia bacterium]
DFLLSSAAGGSRDLRAYLGRREDAFHFGADANALLEMLDEFEANLAGLLRSVEAGRFAETLDWPEWQSPTVAWCLLGVVEHLREHVGAAALTRQLWDAGPGRETQTLAR